jgi:hypothetical protein
MTLPRSFVVVPVKTLAKQRRFQEKLRRRAEHRRLAIHSGQHAHDLVNALIDRFLLGPTLAIGLGGRTCFLAASQVFLDDPAIRVTPAPVVIFDAFSATSFPRHFKVV